MTREADVHAFFQEASLHPIRVRHVHVDGATHTRGDTVQPALQSLFNASSFNELVRHVNTTTTSLKDLGIFKSVHAEIGTSQDTLGGNGAVIDIDVTLHVEEKSRIWGKTGTNIGNQEGDVYIMGNLCNVLGRAEQLTMNYSRGTRAKSSWLLSLTKPITGHPHRSFNLQAFQSLIDNKDHSSHMQDDMGATATFVSPARLFGLVSVLGLHGSAQASHSLAYNIIWRHVSGLSPGATWGIRQHAGHSLKSSISHTLLLDGRDDPTLPSSGGMLKMSQELAGLGGDTRFFKSENEVQFILPLASLLPFIPSSLRPRYWSVRTTLWSGALLPLGSWGGGRSFSPIGDRFYLGGPQSLRHFLPKGAGPRDGNDAIGGDLYWSTGIHASGPVPFFGQTGRVLQLHGFLNAGNLCPYNPAHGVAGNLCSIASNYRTSAGLGLVLRLGPARLELNWGIPINKDALDRGKAGFQIGLGINYV